MRRVLLLNFLIIYLSNLLSGGIQPTKNVNAQLHQQIKNGFAKLQSSAGHELTVKWNKRNSTPSYIGRILTQPGYAIFSQYQDAGIRFITANKELFALKDPEKELKVSSVYRDELNQTHVKYEQWINDVRVFYSDLIVHFNPDGSIESFSGTYMPTPELNLNPKISEQQAIKKALTKINYIPESQRAELVIYPFNNLSKLSYLISLPVKDFPKMIFFIDAETGEILRKDDGLRYEDGPAKGKGISLSGEMKNLETYLSQGVYYLIDATLPMYVPPIKDLKGVIQTWDAYNDTAKNGYEKAVLITDPDNNNIFNDNERLKAAVDAHVYTRIVYEFYRSHYNRNSWDDAGGALINVVHYKEMHNNAFWNGAFMSYGDGDGEKLSNLAGALDVIGHEITHGVISSTADLVYELEPGAINESIADVFGVLIDSTNWQIGEQVYTPSIFGDALRDMSNPHNGQVFGDVLNGWQPEHMDEFMIYPNDEDHDWGGVHVNSGILNKAFYNTAVAIGHWKSGKIWYRTLTVYLTRYSQFSEMAEACINSARDLYGEGSAEEKAVKAAFVAVGIIEETPVFETITLIYDDGEPAIGVYEEYPMWQLGVRFSPPVKDYYVTQVQVFIMGDQYGGNGEYKLGTYKADPVTGLPGEGWLPPTNMIPADSGWQVYDLYGGGTFTGDFYVTALYDGAGYPIIGADLSPGNGRAYEYDLTKHAWVKLESPNDFTLFMRASVKTLTTEVTMDTKIPSEFRLEQNYPNPFNPTTTIKYSLPQSTDVKIDIYDIAGNHVTQLVNNHQLEGSYSITWNGHDESGHSVASGIYYYRLHAGKYQSTNKMCLIK